jgi:hypothetical protein
MPYLNGPLIEEHAVGRSNLIGNELGVSGGHRIEILEYSYHEIDITIIWGRFLRICYDYTQRWSCCCGSRCGLSGSLCGPSI